jgi:DNA-binding NtrC family response regulator
MQRSRVLVVEDRPSVLKFMATILEGGYEVTTAADGTSALSIIGERPVDVVLADVRMPGASGFDVLQAVRQRTPRTAVVLMTAYANVPDAVEAMRGAADYLVKPLDADEIALAVARALERHRDAPEVVPDELGPADAGDAPPSSLVGFHRAIEEARHAASRAYLVKLLRTYRGNVTQAARQARMTRESLHRVLRRYGVHCEQYRVEAGGAAVEGEDDGLSSGAPTA